MKEEKLNVLCICAKGMNRSKYLAKYLKEKGYFTKWGGVEPYEKPEYEWNPVSQKEVDWSDVIIIVRERISKIFKDKFNTKNKRIIVLDVSDSPRLIPEEFKELRVLNHKEFNQRWTYPQLENAIKPYLPLAK